MYDRSLEALKTYFGYPTFRSGQWDVIESILKRQDTLAIMPTSAGKSVCYQIPALVSDGSCIVISPLIALMKDQVDQLLKRNISAIAINSSLGQNDIKSIYKNMSDFKFIYLSPERLNDKRFRESVSKLDICFIAIDEAHCISQWGHQFRPAYREIAKIRDIKNCSFIALTATATKVVADDIIHNLNLKSPKLIIKGFDRPNLKWIVLYEKDKLKKIREICSAIAGSGIIYASTRKKVEEIYDYISKRTNISVAFYHGGLDAKTRIQIQDEYIGNQYDLLISTNAFGMGVDKPDVRFVIHYELSADLEAYYQEAGRAGRDGENSYCILLYDYSDSAVHEYFFNRSIPNINELKNVVALFDSRKEIRLSEIRTKMGLDNDKTDLLIQFLIGKSIIHLNSENIIVRSDDQEMIDQLFEKYEHIKSDNRNRLNAMIEFCEYRRCRRNMILIYFGENPGDSYCGRCDICIGRNKSEIEIRHEFIEIFSELLNTYNERFGVITICDILQGKQSDMVLKHRLYRNRFYANFNMFSRRYIIRTINELITDRTIIRTKGKFPVLKLNTTIN